MGNFRGAGTVPGAAFAKDPGDFASATRCMPVQCFGRPSEKRRGVLGCYTAVTQRSFVTKWLRQVRAVVYSPRLRESWPG